MLDAGSGQRALSQGEAGGMLWLCLLGSPTLPPDPGARQGSESLPQLDSRPSVTAAPPGPHEATGCRGSFLRRRTTYELLPGCGRANSPRLRDPSESQGGSRPWRHPGQGGMGFLGSRPGGGLWSEGRAGVVSQARQTRPCPGLDFSLLSSYSDYTALVSPGQFPACRRHPVSRSRHNPRGWGIFPWEVGATVRWEHSEALRFPRRRAWESQGLPGRVRVGQSTGAPPRKTQGRGHRVL